MSCPTGSGISFPTRLATGPFGLRQKTRPLAHLTVQLLLIVLLCKPNVVKQCPSCPIPCPALMQASAWPAVLATIRCAGLPTIHHAGPATARFCQGSQGPIAWRRGEGGILHGRPSPQNMVGERFLGKVPRLFFHLPHCCNRRAQGGPLHRAHRNARMVAGEPRSASRRCLQYPHANL